MTLNLIKQVTMLERRSFIEKISLVKRYKGSLYEPDYLETGKPKIPIMPEINIQIKAYDYPILESYQSFIHKLANIMEINVNDSWPVPAQKFKVQRYKTGTTVIMSEYELKIYERNTQLSEIFSTKCPILIRALEAALPQGVNMKIDIYDPEMKKIRYVPDKELLDLKTELETIRKK